MGEVLAKEHTYVVCAYGKSAYLQECIDSLLRQSKKSNIIMVSSTPSDFLDNISKKYGISLYINEGQKGIAGDWNFGLSMVKTPIATIAHQDDVYEPWYTEKVLQYINESKRPLIFFSDYGEIRNGIKEKNNKLLIIKRLMLFPLRLNKMSSSIFVRRRILSFGSPISCPTVSYFLPNLQSKIFESHYKSDLDWQAWEKISRYNGEFLFAINFFLKNELASDSDRIIYLNSYDFLSLSDLIDFDCSFF